MVVNVLRWETWRERTWGSERTSFVCIEFVFLVRCSSGQVMWGADVWMLSSEGRSGLNLPTKGPQSIDGVQSH